MILVKALVALALITTAAARSDAQQQPTRTVKRAANADTAKLPYNVAAPASTPAFVHPPDPGLLPLDSVANLIGATTASPTSVLGRAAGLLSTTVKAVGGGKNCLDSKSSASQTLFLPLERLVLTRSSPCRLCHDQLALLLCALLPSVGRAPVDLD